MQPPIYILVGSHAYMQRLFKEGRVKRLESIRVKSEFDFHGVSPYRSRVVLLHGWTSAYPVPILRRIGQEIERFYAMGAEIVLSKNLTSDPESTPWKVIQ